MDDICQHCFQDWRSSCLQTAQLEANSGGLALLLYFEQIIPPAWIPKSGALLGITIITVKLLFTVICGSTVFSAEIAQRVRACDVQP